MPQMHPSWTTNLLRKQFGCASFLFADDLMLNAISAYAATSRALLTGDVTRHTSEREISTGGCHSDTFDWLFYKGKTIQLINSRMANSRGAIADTIIAAICDLIFLEVSTLDFE
jgi:hypothetical protein